MSNDRNSVVEMIGSSFRKDLQVATNYVTCMVSFRVVMSLASLLFMGFDRDMRCEKDDVMAMNLSDWLLVYGLTGLTCGLFKVITVMIKPDARSHLSRPHQLFLFSFVLIQFFFFAWMIVGVVLYARSGTPCYFSGSDQETNVVQCTFAVFALEGTILGVFLWQLDCMISGLYA